MNLPRNTLLLALAGASGFTGGWALAAPESWWSDFPGFGRDWLATLGPYSEHLARDFGGAYLALAALLATAALAPAVKLARAVPAAFLVFSLPHLAFHVAHVGELPPADDVVNLVLLALSVLLPAALLLPERGRRRPAGPTGPGRLGPARSRNPLVMAIRAVVKRRFGHVVGPVAVTAHHPPLLSAYAVFELLLERSHKVDRRLEELAATLASNRTGCPFCIDFAGALAGQVGIAPEKVAELDHWRDSDVYSDDERLVLEYADGMCQTPVDIDDALFARLAARFDAPAIVELTAAIAFENYRGRFNHALGLGSEGFCDARPTVRSPVAASSLPGA